MGEVEGEVVRRKIFVGSKSEQVAVVLDAGDETYIIRLKGDDQFIASGEIDSLVGKRVRMRGTTHVQTFMVDSYDVL